MTSLRGSAAVSLVMALSLCRPAAAQYVAVDLGTLGGRWSLAVGQNNLGQVVGSSETASGAVHAFIWSSQVGMLDLGTLGGMNSRAWEVNSSGVIIGTSD